MPSFKRAMEVFPRFVARISCEACSDTLETSGDDENETSMKAQQELLKRCKDEEWGFDGDGKPLCNPCYEDYNAYEDEDEEDDGWDDDEEDDEDDDS